MNGFSFPPPPPPPPKPQQPQHAESRGRGRGRGDHRGSFDQRGRSQARVRGNHQNGSSRGTFPPALRGRDQHRSNGDEQADHQHPRDSTRQGQSSQYTQTRSFHSSYTSNVQTTTATFPPRLNSLQNSQAAFKATGPNHDRPNRQSQSPSRTIAGHKRKLEALKGSPPREKKPGPATAPAIPSFGAPILPSEPTPASYDSKPKGADPSSPKATKRSLGLTPGTDDPQHSSSDSDNDDERDVDEEAAHAELGDKLTFEHNGVLMSLNSQADLVAWKKERRKNWPTARRMAEKHRERQRIGEERKRLLAAANPPRQVSRTWQRSANPAIEEKSSRGQRGSDAHQQQESNKPAKPETELEKAKREVDDRTKQLEMLRKKVADSEARNRMARSEQASRDEAMSSKTEQNTEATEAGDTAVSTHDVQSVDNVAGGGEAASQDSPQSLLEDSSVVSSDSASKIDSETKLDSEDDAPEEVASKPSHAATDDRTRPICRYFAASGYCRDGDVCPFKHERPSGVVASNWQQGPRVEQRQPNLRPIRPWVEEEQGAKKGIFERLMEQEQHEENKLALKVIKYLGSIGFFSEGSQAAIEQE